MKNKKNNKMPKIIKFSLFLCLLGIFSGGLLALVNEYNEKIVEENIYNTDSKFSCKRILLKFFNITYVTMKAIFNILKKSFIIIELLLK